MFALFKTRSHTFTSKIPSDDQSVPTIRAINNLYKHFPFIVMKFGNFIEGNNNITSLQIKTFTSSYLHKFYHQKYSLVQNKM